MASPPPTPSVLPNKGGLIATLTPNDVLSGRGKLVNSHPGNIRFLTHIVPEYLEEYSHSTTTRTERAHVVARLVNEVRSRSNPPGRFLTACKDNPGQYTEIGDEKAWKKAARALQDASKNKSSDAIDTSSRVLPANNNSQEKLKSPNSTKNKRSRGKDTTTCTSHHQQPLQPSTSDRRLVIIRPSSNNSNDDDNNDDNSTQHVMHEQWPHYRRLCRLYGFAVEVEQFLEPCKVNEMTVETSTTCHDEMGPPQLNNLLRVDNNSCFVMGNFSARFGVIERGGEFVRLRRIGERLSVRLLACSSSIHVNNNRKSNNRSMGSKSKTNNNAKNNAVPHQHPPPPNLNDGDIIQTLDGKPDPTFSMLYGMMCRNEKLVLEVINGGEANGSGSSTGGKKRGDEHIESSTVTGTKATRKARKQPVVEREDVTAEVSNALDTNPGISNRSVSKNWNAAAAQKARELLLSEDNEIEHFIGDTGAESAGLHVDASGNCTGDNRNGNNEAAVRGRKARKQSYAVERLVIPEATIACSTNPTTTNCAGSKKWNAAAAQKAREDLFSESEVDNCIRGTRTATDAVLVDLNTTPRKASNSGVNGNGSNDASSTVPAVARKARNQSNANGGHAVAETGATIDSPSADGTIPERTAFHGSNRKGQVNNGVFGADARGSIVEWGTTSAHNAYDNTREKASFSSVTGPKHTSKANLDSEREQHTLMGIMARAEAALAGYSSPGGGNTASDLSEIEQLPREIGVIDECIKPTASTPLSIPNLASRWEPPQRGCERNANTLSSNTSDRVSQLERDGSGNNNRTGINGINARDTTCKQMEDDLFNMVEEDLSREQQQRNVASDDDRIMSSSMLNAVHVGNPPSFPPPTLDATARTDDDRPTIASSAESHSATEVANISATWGNDQSVSTDKVVSTSSSSSHPALFDCTGDDDDSVSSSSCPSSSSAVSTSSSSSTNSSSSSNNGNVSSHTKVRIPTSQLEPVGHATTVGALDNVATNLHAPSLSARKRPPATVISIGSSKSSYARPSSSSLQNDAIEAPTSLSRLWPDPSDIIKALTRWMPPVAQTRTNAFDSKRIVEFYGPIRCNDYYGPGNEQSRYNPLLMSSNLRRNGEVPREFKNADEVMDIMASTLLNEGLHSINADYHAEKYSNGRWNRCSYQMRMTKLTEVTPIFQSQSYFDGSIKLYEAQFSAHGETNLPPSNLSELYCMHFPRWECSKFGIVAHDFPTTMSFRTYNEGKSLLKLWLVVHQTKQNTNDTGWLSRTDFRELLDPHQNDLAVKHDAILTLISCGSTTNVVRQFEAIKCLPYLKPHLQRALFSTYKTSVPTSTTNTKPRSLPIDVWHHLKSSHNSYQLSAISKLLAGSCRENVCLVQGPPGTGKSSTIVGLVSALLAGKAPLPQQRQFGCLIHPGKSMGTTFAEPQARNRILVCAATNQAVDSLAWKIKQGSIGPSGKVGDFTMARYGSLPWEHSRNVTDQKPEILSSMEDFLFEINVDRRSSDGMQDFEYYEEEHEQIMSWSPEKMKPQRKKRRKVVGRAKIRSQVLGSCSVVITTLSGAGSKAFIDAVCRDPTRNDSEFDAVIIDEACQASEPESLIPFKYNPTTITLVGDPQQLPVLTLGTSAENKLYERSLFERLQSLNFPIILLRNQYRMHEDIAAFPSQQFYNGKLITPNSVKDRPTPCWAACPCFPSVCFWDTSGQYMPNGSRGFRNNQEVEFITKTILSTFAHTVLGRSDEVVNIGIISFYRDQVQLLTEQLAKIPELNNSMLNVKVATVDGFQGSECDIVILSCVRSHSHGMRDGPRRNTVGFLNDYRRVNVALTRAKFSLWIVGDARVLNSSELWWKLLQDMDRRRVLRRDDEFRDIFARWKSDNNAS